MNHVKAVTAILLGILSVRGFLGMEDTTLPKPLFVFGFFVAVGLFAMVWHKAKDEGKGRGK